MWCRILMLASAVFYYGFGQTGNTSPATLFDAYDLLQSTLGQGELLGDIRAVRTSG